VHQARLRNANITVEKRKRARRLVECLEDDILDVLVNIIANSIDAMPSGGRLIVRSREHTDIRTGRKGLTLTIADTGTGMSPAAQRKAFDAFFSTKDIGGIGLGLWVAADTVKRHHGRIAIRSSQRKGHTGTVTTIFLPFAESSAPHA
jgi:signal transduction histidine kinase